MAGVDDVVAQLMAPRASAVPAMGSAVDLPASPELARLVQGARNQLATQPQRFPTSYGNPQADAAAMSPETYANPLAVHVLGSLATIPQRALGAAANLQTTGDYNPGPILEAATLPMGAGITGVPLRSGETAVGAGLIRGDTPEARQAWSELRQEVTKRKVDQKAFEDALARPVEDSGPSVTDGMTDAQLANHMDNVLRGNRINWDRNSVGNGLPAYNEDAHVIEVPVNALDQAFKKTNPNFYVNTPSSQVADYAVSGKPMSLPEIDVAHGQVNFTNGRNRVAAARQMGESTIPISTTTPDELTALLSRFSDPSR